MKTYKNMLKQFTKPNTLITYINDSYDLWNACANLWGGELRREVRDSGAVVIIRPDSGHPATVVLKCVQILEEKFGSTVNSKGFKVLDNVRVIQGDGINEDSIQEILDLLLSNGYSATNIAFGMGGQLLQALNRDTQKFAMKCSHVFIGGKSVEVFKDPVTDPGKVSKAGRLDLIYTDNGYETVKLSENEISHPKSIMYTTYENGEILHETTFDKVRAQARLDEYVEEEV